MLGSSRWLVMSGILVAGLLASFAQANYPPPERLTGMNPCISKQTCHECIQTPHCAWCAAPVSISLIWDSLLFSLYCKLFRTDKKNRCFSWQLTFIWYLVDISECKICRNSQRRGASFRISIPRYSRRVLPITRWILTISSACCDTATWRRAVTPLVAAVQEEDTTASRACTLIFRLPVHPRIFIRRVRAVAEVEGRKPCKCGHKRSIWNLE